MGGRVSRAFGRMGAIGGMSTPASHADRHVHDREPIVPDIPFARRGCGPRRGLAALVALAVLSPVPAEARPLAPIGDSGNVFLARCESGRPEPCRAYLSGIVDGLIVAGMAMKTNLICPPPGVTTSQVHDIVVVFILDNPMLRHLRTDELAYKALAAAFPCVKRNPPKRR